MCPEIASSVSSRAIQSDLAALHGPDCTSFLPLLEIGRRYARRVEEAAQGDGARLIAHAYTRYMGDLSGGQTMRRLLIRSVSLPACAQSFYSFPEIGDIEAFKTGYRETIDRAGRSISKPDMVVAEATIAFLPNIEVSVAVQAAAVHPRIRISLT